MGNEMPFETKANTAGTDNLEEEFAQQLGNELENNGASPEVKSDKTVQHTERIDVNEKIESQNGTRLDFMSEVADHSFVKQKTKVAETVVSPEGKVFPTSDEIKAGEKKQDDKLKPEDLEMVAEFIVTLIDTIIPHGLKLWSKDSSDKAYSLPEHKKKVLIKQLTYILIKNQTKFKIEIIFFIGLIMFYIPAFIKAKDNRKENKKAEADKKAIIQARLEEEAAKQQFVVRQETPPAYMVNENPKNGETEYVDLTNAREILPLEKKKSSSMPLLKKRKPGGQKKS